MFNFFRRKSSKTSKVIFSQNSASWSLAGKRDVKTKAYADEGYCQNVIVYQAINKTADAIASIPFYVTNARGKEVKDSDFEKLLRNPNAGQSYQEFMKSIVGYYRIAGNAYIERVLVGSQVRELYSLRPDRMSIKTNSSGSISQYCYSVNSKPVTWDVDPIIGDGDIRHMRTFNPLDDLYGMSPIAAGAYAVDQHNESMRHIQALLQNGASPSGAMKVETELNDEQFNRLKAEIDSKFSGSRNAGRPMLLEGGMDWVQMGISPADLEMLQTKYSAARDISLALGVPPLLLNIPGDSTYSNYKEARLAFYEELVIPTAQMIVDELNQWLSPYFGGLKINLDLDSVPAIAEKRRELWDMADKATDLTINERRAMKGFEPIEGGDTLLVQSMLVPLSFATEELTIPVAQKSQLTASELKSIAYGSRSGSK